MAKFTYTTRKDGRLMKKVTVNGKPKYLYSDNPKDLEKQYIEIKYNSNRGIHLENSEITVKQWANEWLKTYKKDKEKATYDMYEQVIRIYIIPKLGSIKLKNLKQKDVISLLNDMDNKGITRRKEVVLLTMKQILEKAKSNDYIYKNICDDIKIKKHISEEKKPLSDNLIMEIKKLAENDFHAFMILFMIYTGLRKQEVVPLQYKDIDLESGYITIDKAIVYNHNQPIIKSTKNKCPRKVPILNIILDKLKTLKKEHKDNDYIFPDNNKKMMTKTRVDYILTYVRRLLNQNSEKKVSFTYHQLRHTYVCILHKAGVDLKEAQSFTGHKTIKVLLDIYTHLDNQDKMNAIKKLNVFTMKDNKDILKKEEIMFLKQILEFKNHKYNNSNIKIIKKENCIKLKFNSSDFDIIYIDKTLYFKKMLENKEYSFEDLGIK